MAFKDDSSSDDDVDGKGNENENDNDGFKATNKTIYAIRHISV